METKAKIRLAIHSASAAEPEQHQSKEDIRGPNEGRFVVVLELRSEERTISKGRIQEGAGPHTKGTKHHAKCTTVCIVQFLLCMFSLLSQVYKRLAA